MRHTDLFGLENIPEITDDASELDGYELDVIFLEKEMTHKNGGLLLNNLREREDYALKHRDYFQGFLSFFEQWDVKSVQKLANRYESINSPCSMLVNSPEELLKHMLVAYQVAHFNYILSELRYGNFPYKHCVASSLNVAFSLMDFGYPNSSYVYTTKGHGYVELPFVLKNEKKEETINGVVGIDPTSDQLWKNKDKRNMVFIRLGTKWEYRTDWTGKMKGEAYVFSRKAEGTDLFPDRIFSIDVMKTFPYICDRYEEYPSDARNGEIYLEKAFSNPVKIRE